MINRILLGISIVAIVGIFMSLAIVGQNQAVSQEMENSDIIVDTETIPLTGRLQPGDFKLLMDITGYLSVGGHVAAKIPCGPNGEQLLAIVAGVAPDVTPLDLEYVAPLSNPPDSCLYHAEIPEGITDIALINTSDERVKFFGMSSAGYSITINIKGVSSGDHM